MRAGIKSAGSPVAPFAVDILAIDLETEARTIRLGRAIKFHGSQAEGLRLAVGLFIAAQDARGKLVERLPAHPVRPPEFCIRDDHAAGNR